MIRTINQWLTCLALILIIVFVIVSTTTVVKIYCKMQDLEGPLKKVTESVEILHKRLVDINTENKTIFQGFKDLLMGKPTESK